MTYNIKAGTNVSIMRKGSYVKEAFTTRVDLAFTKDEVVYNPSKPNSQLAEYFFMREGHALIAPLSAVTIERKRVRTPKQIATPEVVEVAPPAPAPAPQVQAEFVADVHYGLQVLAGVCDGAHRLDGQGFARIDAEFGHSLAKAFRLTPKQAIAGARLIRKYQRQLPADLVARVTHATAN